MSPDRGHPDTLGAAEADMQEAPEVGTPSQDREPGRAGSLSKLILVSFPFLILILLLLLDWWARGSP